MSLIKLFEIIDASFIGKFVTTKRKIIEATDPERIYVENIRSFFNLPYRLAKLLCEMAVRAGYFSRHYGIYCPNDDCGRLVLSVENTSDIPFTVNCKICELLERENHEFQPTDRNIIVFYKLVKEIDGENHS